jgi:hypothetical protein
MVADVDSLSTLSRAGRLLSPCPAVIAPVPLVSASGISDNALAIVVALMGAEECAGAAACGVAAGGIAVAALLLASVEDNGGNPFVCRKECKWGIIRSDSSIAIICCAHISKTR